MIVFQLVITNQFHQPIPLGLKRDPKDNVVIGQVGGEVRLPQPAGCDTAIDVVGA